MRLVPDSEQGLELGSFRLLVDDGGLDAGETRLFEQVFQLRFAEAEPLVCVEFAGFFEAMLDQIENDDATAGLRESAQASESRNPDEGRGGATARRRPDRLPCR